jgi:hypothetical protein
MNHTNEVLETALDIDNLFTIEELRDKMETKLSLKELKATCTTMHELHYLNKIDDKFLISYKGTLQNLERETKRLLNF